MPSMRQPTVGRLLVLALAAGGCAALQVGTSSTRRALAQAAGALASSQLLPALAADGKQVKKFKRTESGAVYFDLKEGGGYSPQPGDFVVVTYRGYLANGKRARQLARKLSHLASRRSLTSAPLCRVDSHRARASRRPLSVAWTRSLRFIRRSGQGAQGREVRRQPSTNAQGLGGGHGDDARGRHARGATSAGPRVW